MANDVEINQATGIVRVELDGSITICPGSAAQGLAFYSPAGAGPFVQQQTVTGSKGGNAALASLISALANLGLIVDGSS
jgi:hypothetical protein